MQDSEKAMKILMVLTSHDQLGDTGKKTGFWLEEFAAPYFVFKDAGANRRWIRRATNPMRKPSPPDGSRENRPLRRRWPTR
jgi:hypothetical protein